METNSHAVVASENKLCSEIGVDILKKHGSVIDSIIATSFCIGTVNFQSSGIGGGGFLVYHSPEESLAFNFREKAPKAAFVDMYKNNQQAAKV